MDSLTFDTSESFFDSFYKMDEKFYPDFDGSYDGLCNLGTIDSDPIRSDLYEQELTNPASIYSDVQKFESYDDSALGFFNFDDFESEIKPEIRNVNCMWSSYGPAVSSSLTSTHSDSIGTSMPLSAVTGNTQNIINKHTNVCANSTKQQPIVVVANNNKKQQNLECVAIKTELTTDDYEQQLQQHNILNNKPNSVQSSTQDIPPGASLLRKSNMQNQQKRQMYIQMNEMPNRDNVNPIAGSNKSKISAVFQRPDTPHSLDDDAPEFKHNVDLRACIIGSNEISLTEDQYINRVSQELQDTTKVKIDSRFTHGCDSITEVLDILSDENAFNTIGKHKSKHFGATLSRHHSLPKDSDEESSCDSSSLEGDRSFGMNSPSSSQGYSSSSMSSSRHFQQQSSQLHSDHSYTRCKGINDVEPHIDTPSDSDEEIDVVSVGDKKLPTNPSDKDRRVLQTKVAHKFSNARIVKTPNGVRTIPPRRRISYELPYTPASSSPVKSVANSRYPSPASTPFQNQYTNKYVQQQQQVYAPILSDGHFNSSSHNEKYRKRINGPLSSEYLSVVTDDYSLPPSKKRGKKSSSKHVSPAGSVGLKRHLSLDEADTIEKRNLHNDMERQRRIGLKNLFEALKKQIPSIREKERAPKVNILREAAKLCEQLTREDQELCEMKASLKEQLRRNQELLARLRAARNLD